MGKGGDQVYFMEKWSKRQGLKIAVSQQFSYVNIFMIIFSLSVPIVDTQMHIYIYIYIYIYINCFVCFFIYYMCDGSIASIASPII